ncbi:hypothetical protein BZY95_06275 [Billgrantia desiderata SP1]|nr:hypothetical protein BZY95_06275 [Halomonas desiderata SP1]
MLHGDSSHVVVGIRKRQALPGEPLLGQVGEGYVVKATSSYPLAHRGRVMSRAGMRRSLWGKCHLMEGIG